MPCFRISDSDRQIAGFSGKKTSQPRASQQHAKMPRKRPRSPKISLLWHQQHMVAHPLADWPLFLVDFVKHTHTLSKTAKTIFFAWCAAAPKFSEIGKLGRDLLEEDHKYDSKVQVKTKLDTGTVRPAFSISWSAICERCIVKAPRCGWDETMCYSYWLMSCCVSHLSSNNNAAVILYIQRCKKNISQLKLIGINSLRTWSSIAALIYANVYSRHHEHFCRVKCEPACRTSLFCFVGF